MLLFPDDSHIYIFFWYIWTISSLSPFHSKTISSTPGLAQFKGLSGVAILFQNSLQAKSVFLGYFRWMESQKVWTVCCRCGWPFFVETFRFREGFLLGKIRDGNWWINGARWAGVVLTRGKLHMSNAIGAALLCTAVCQMSASRNPRFQGYHRPQISHQNGSTCHAIRHVCHRNEAHCLRLNWGHCVQWHSAPWVWGGKIFRVLKPAKPLRSYWMVREWTFQKPWRRFVCPASDIYHFCGRGAPYGNLEGKFSLMWSWGPTTEEVRLTP